MTINPAALTVTADNNSKIYGDANPAFTASYTGFVLGQDETALGGSLSFNTPATASSDVGPYSITPSGYTSTNYTISFVDGTLTIDPAALTVTADNNSKIYGDANPAFTASYTGFVLGQDETALGGSLSFNTPATASSDVGPYSITPSGYTSTNYTISFVDGTLTIDPAALTVTADNKSKIYGDANPAFTASYTGFVLGQDETALGGSLSFNTPATASSDVCPYSITPSGYTSTNYTISYTDGTLTIDPAALTVTADNKSKIYGDANPAFTASYTGFVLGQDETALGGSLSFNTPATASSDVGPYSITPSGYTSTNYTISYTDGTLTIDPAVLTVTADNNSKIYGDANPAFTASYTGFVLGQDETALGGSLSFNTPATASSNVGPYSITPSGYTSTNYTISYTDGTLTIDPAALTVTADNNSKIYGDANPAFTASYTGFVLGQDETALGGSLSFNTPATASSDVGPYSITPSGYTSTNYTISFVDGTLTIDPAALTVKADNNSKIYGDANPAFTASYTGFVLGQDETALGGSLSFNTPATASSDVGPYSITPSGYTSTNYTISFVDGTLTIDPAALTVTADNNSKIYGDANPAFTASYTGFVLGQDETALGGSLSFNTPATASSDVGPYSITPSGYTSTNYTISFVDGTLTINPAALTVTADNNSKIYGDANPAFTASYTGFVLGQDETALGGSLSFNTPATASSDVGPYSITPSGYTSTNYTISFVDGTLTIDPAALTVTADNNSKIYGDANPAFTASYTGFVLGQDETALGGSLSFNTPATASSDVGPYSITPSGYTSTNYTISFVDGTLTIDPAALTVTADNKSKIYGDANPAFTASYTGFVLGQDETALGGSLSFNTPATASSDVCPYSITPSGYTSTNYTISYTDGTLTIDPAALTVTADNKSKIYGDANPAFTASYTGFVLGQDETALGGSLSFNTPATASSDVGPYSITPSGYTSTNYTISYTDGTLTIDPAVLTVTADNNSKIYGDANPAFTASYTGFVLGQDETALGGSLSFNTPATASSNVGPYSITPSGYTSTNYTISYTDGTLTIDPAALTVTADNNSKIYGDANPAFTASYTGFVLGQDETALGGSLSFNTPATASSDVGPYSITPSGYTSTNYTISFVDGTLTIDPAALTVKADNNSKIYGDANPAFTASYTGFVLGQDETALGGSLSFNTPATASSDVGPYSITPSGYTSTNYTISFVDGTLTINPAALTVTADNNSKIYGDANPAFTASYTGFVLGQDETALGGSLSFNTPATASSDVGPYSITPSGYTSTNYTISFVDGTLTIDPAALTVTADNNSKIYGDANPAFTASYTGFVLGQDETALGGSLSFNTPATASSDVGPYSITPSGYTSTNYTISFVDGTLTIDPAALTVTADNNSKIYGDANPAFTASYTGFVLGQDETALGGSLSFNTPATASSDVCPYSITPSGYTSTNYTISYTDGTLTIDPAALTVTADNKSKIYGDANPAFTASYTGFVLGQDETALGGSLSFNTPATASSDVGPYSITPSGYTSTNYTISYTDGTLTIDPAVLTVTADNNSKIYGDANPAFTASYAGFVLGQDETALGGSLSFNTPATASSDVGPYSITPSGYTSTNYTISFVDGTLTIDPAALTVKADNNSKIYGDANPAFTTSYTGFVLGQDETALGGSLSFNTPATASSDVGPYSITPSGYTSTNYTISFVDGTLTIDPADMQADDQNHGSHCSNFNVIDNSNNFISAVNYNIREVDNTVIIPNSNQNHSAYVNEEAGYNNETSNGIMPVNTLTNSNNSSSSSNSNTIPATYNMREASINSNNNMFNLVYSHNNVHSNNPVYLSNQYDLSLHMIKDQFGNVVILVIEKKKDNFTLDVINTGNNIDSIIDYSFLEGLFSFDEQNLKEKSAK